MADSGGSSASARRSTAVVLVAAAVVVAAAGVGGAVGAASGSTATQTADSSNPVEFVYVDGSTSELTFVRADGTKVSTDVSDAEVVGSMADFDDDGLLEAPYVNSSGVISVVDVQGETEFLASKTYKPSNKKTVIGTGDWTGDGDAEVVYANTSHNKHLYYANTTGTPMEILGESARAALGVSDFDGDNRRDLVYVGSSSGNLWYYNGTETVDTTYQSFGSNNGFGAGRPANIYQNGTVYVPSATDSGNLELVNASGDSRLITGSPDKAPVGAANWTGSEHLEILYLANGVVKYSNPNGGRERSRTRRTTASTPKRARGSRASRAGPPPSRSASSRRPRPASRTSP